MQVDKHLLKSPSRLGGGEKVARTPGSVASDCDRQQVLSAGAVEQVSVMMASDLLSEPCPELSAP